MKTGAGPLDFGLWFLGNLDFEFGESGLFGVIGTRIVHSRNT